MQRACAGRGPPLGLVPGGPHEVGQQDRVGEGTDAARHGRDRRGDPGRGFEVHVADEAPLDDVDADVDHDGAWLEHLAGDEARPAGGDHDHDPPRARWAARSGVREWQMVTVACSRRRRNAAGLPTTLERPTTTARRPASATPERFRSSTAAWAVAGRKPS